MFSAFRLHARRCGRSDRKSRRKGPRRLGRTTRFAHRGDLAIRAFNFDAALFELAIILPRIGSIATVLLLATGSSIGSIRKFNTTSVAISCVFLSAKFLVG